MPPNDREGRLEEKLQLEEYKLVKSRLDTHEKRYFDLLLLAVGSLAAALGLADRIPTALLPIGLGLVLVAATELAVGSRVNQYYASAYLLEAFDNKFAGLNYERMYVDLFDRRIDWSTSSRPTRAVRALRDPFTLVNAAYAFVTVYFGGTFVMESELPLAPFGSAAYIALLATFHLQMLRSVAALQRQTPETVRRRVAEWRRGLTLAPVHPRDDGRSR